MTFTTKYEKDQKLWSMKGKDVGCKPVELVVLAIQAYLEEGGHTRITYKVGPVENPISYETLHESYLFPTKKDLLDSL